MTSGDVVAPEDASWARVEDLAELASLMGMIAPAPESVKTLRRPATRPNLNFGNALDEIPSEDEPTGEEEALLNTAPTTKPPPLPSDEAMRSQSSEGEEEAKTVYSGPPSFENDAGSSVGSEPFKRTQDWGTWEAEDRSRSLEAKDDPLSKSLRPSAPSAEEYPSLSHDSVDEEELLSRPISKRSDAPQTHEVMSQNLKRAQRRRVIFGSIFGGMLVAAAIFFAIQNLKEASTPPEDTTKAVAPAVEKSTEGEDKGSKEATSNEVQESEESASKTLEAEPSTPKDQGQESDKENAKGGDEKPQENNQASLNEGSKPNAAPGDLARKNASTKAGTTTSSPKKEGGKGKAESGSEAQAKIPQTIDGLLSRAKKVRKKNPGEALALYTRVLQKKPNHGDAMQLAARAHMQLGQHSSAVDLLKACRKKRPRFSPCLYYLGRAFEAKGDAANAKKVYKQLIDESPESSLAIKARKRLGN